MKVRLRGTNGAARSPPTKFPLCRSTLFAMMPRRSSLHIFIVLVFTISGLLFAQTTSSTRPECNRSRFGTRDGRPVNLYTLTNSHGVEIHAMNYGGIILSIRVPDRKGQFADIVLGHDTLEGYIPNPPYFGAIVGRYAQPHRQRHLHARRQDVHAAEE